MKLHTAGPELAGIFRDRILRRGRAWPGASACFSCIKGSGRDRRRMSYLPLGTEFISRFLQRVGDIKWWSLGDAARVAPRRHGHLLSGIWRKIVLRHGDTMICRRSVRGCAGSRFSLLTLR